MRKPRLTKRRGARASASARTAARDGFVQIHLPHLTAVERGTEREAIEVRSTVTERSNCFARLGKYRQKWVQSRHTFRRPGTAVKARLRML